MVSVSKSSVRSLTLVELARGIVVMRDHFSQALLIFIMAVVIWPNASMAMSTDTELLLIDDDLLKGRVMPAISAYIGRNDSGPAKQLVLEATSGQQFQMAIKPDANGGRTIAQYLASGSEELLNGKLPQEILDDNGQTIRDQELIRRRQTQTVLSRFLVLFLCAWSKNGIQMTVPLSRSQLSSYLRSRSAWMEDFLGSSNELLWNAPNMPLPIGGEAKLLTREEAHTLLDKLREVSPPAEGQTLTNQYETLKQLLEIAAANPRFRILIRTT